MAGTLPALKWVQRLLIGPNAGSLATALDPSGKPNTSIPGVVSVSSPLSASLVLAAYAVVCLGLSCHFVNRRDVT